MPIPFLAAAWTGIKALAGKIIPKVAGWLGGSAAKGIGAAAQAAIPPLAKGAWEAKSAERDRELAERSLRQQRSWALEDALKNRKTAAAYRKSDRRSAASWRKNERNYAEGYRDNERAYSEEMRDAERAYSERIAARNLRQAKGITAEQREYDRGTFARLRDDAIKAGFNPVTALGGQGALVGSGTMVNPAFSGAVQSGSAASSPIGLGVPAGGGPPMNSEWQPVALPALASSAYIGEALGAGIQTWFNREQMARDEEAQALQTAMMRSELQQIQREPTGHLEKFGYAIPQAVGTGTSSGRTYETALPSLVGPDADAVMTQPLFKRYEVSPGNTSWTLNFDELDEFLMHGLPIAAQQAAKGVGYLARSFDRAAGSTRVGDNWKRFGTPGEMPVWRP